MIEGRVITVDALLTQRALAGYLLDRRASYLFTVKGNQKTLMDDIRLLMDEAMAERPPDFVQEGERPEHGRMERRSIWASTEINGYVRFPGVGLRRPPGGHRGEDRREAGRDRMRRHQPGPGGRLPEAPAGAEPRPLAGRGQSPHS